jgi:hypothetical protein
MAFSVSKSLSFRSLGLYKKSTGRHAAPKGWVPEQRQSVEGSTGHRPAHAASLPRLTGADAAPQTADGESKAA